MRQSTDVKIVELQGNARSRGRAHGETLHQEIMECLENWKYFLMLNLSKNPDDAIDEFIGQTAFLAAAKKWTPELVEEIEGIAEASGSRFNDIFSMQLMDEGGWYLWANKTRESEHCSSLGCSRRADAPVLVAQNLDWVNLFTDMGVVLHIRYQNTSLEVLAPTVPGVIGTCGLNNRGIGIVTNALWTALNNSPQGLAVNFIVRAVLEKISLSEALDFMQRFPHASGENYIIGDQEHITDLECSANQVSRFLPYKDADRVYHTNHPLANTDFSSGHTPPPITSSTVARYRYLEYRLGDAHKPLDINIAKSLLRSHNGPICVHHGFQPARGETFCSVVFLLKEKPELYITMGPPCLSEYQRLAF